MNSRDPSAGPFRSPGLSYASAIRRSGQRLDLGWLRRPFAEAVQGLRPTENLRFGRDATGDEAVRNAEDLARHFHPFQGEIGGDGRPVGGTGTSTINSEVQNYRGDFSGGCHRFEADGLRLSTQIEAGRFRSYLRGSLERRRGGFNSNPPGGTVPTRLADLDLTPDDLDRIEIGDVATNGPMGLCVVVAKDTQAGTITFEAVSGGLREDYGGNYHLTFTRFAFAAVEAPAQVEEGKTTEVRLRWPLPSSVVPGSIVRGVRRGERPVNNPRNVAQASVAAISPDRREVRFDRPLRFGSVLQADEGDGILFLPGLWSGQIWSKRSYGPQREGIAVQALRAEITMPAMPNYAGERAWTREAVEDNLGRYPGVLWGYWPAVWLYSWRPDEGGIGRRMVEGARNGWSEVDVMELFVRQGQGPSVWTGNLHKQPYRRVRAMASGSDQRALNGGTWRNSKPDSRIQTPDAAQLLMPEPIADGRRRSVGVLWTRAGVVHYLDDRPVCASAWPVDVDYPHQLGLNVACGSLASGNPASLFFPQSQGDAEAQFMTVHSVQSWEA